MTIPNAVSTSKKASSNPTNQQRPVKEKSKNGPAGKPKGRFGNCANCCCVLAALIIVGFVIAGLVVFRRYELFSFANHYGYHDGDQILASRVAESYNSLLCQTYTVTAWSETGANFYLTDGPAQISLQTREAVIIKNPGLRSDVEFDYRAFYLLPGSMIETTACMSIFSEFPRVQAEVLFIKGEGHFVTWAKDATCASCVEHRVIIPPESICEAMRDVLVSYMIDKADTYYVVITRQHRSEDDVTLRADVTMRIIKTIYDVSKVKQKCLLTSTCTLNLTYNANDDIIVEFPFQEVSFADTDNSFSTDCGLRTKFFILVFLVVPASLIAILTLLCCVCCIHQDRRTKKRPLQKKTEAVKTVFTVEDPDRQKRLPPV